MVRIITATSVAVLAFSLIAHAQEGGGTADEAKAMLLKAAAAVKEDEAKAVETFNKGEGGFLDRDLYVFCGDLKTGKASVTANPNGKAVIGENVKDIKDPTGKQFGTELWYAMNNPEITEVDYMWPRPGADKTPVPKVSLVMKMSDDLGCGVGYYTQQ